MIYQEFQPDSLLKDFIKCYWKFENSTDQKLTFTILPDGYFDLIIALDNHTSKKISLTGIWTKQIDVSTPANLHFFAIRFKPIAAEYILQLNISSLLDTATKMDCSFLQVNQLHFEDSGIVIERLNKNFLAVLGSCKGLDSRKQNLFNLLYETNGNQTIQEYSKNIFWTSRQINRYFRGNFGMPLKTYCNILKSYASYKHIKNGQLYPEQNYFDQSHFIKEIVKHTGHNPSELYQNKNDRFLQLATMTKK